jgi:hypothetical protein
MKYYQNKKYCTVCWTHVEEEEDTFRETLHIRKVLINSVSDLKTKCFQFKLGQLKTIFFLGN